MSPDTLWENSEHLGGKTARPGLWNSVTLWRRLWSQNRLSLRKWGCRVWCVIVRALYLPPRKPILPPLLPLAWEGFIHPTSIYVRDTELLQITCHSQQVGLSDSLIKWYSHPHCSLYSSHSFLFFMSIVLPLSLFLPLDYKLSRIFVHCWIPSA